MHCNDPSDVRAPYRSNLIRILFLKCELVLIKFEVFALAKRLTGDGSQQESTLLTILDTIANDLPATINSAGVC